MDVVGSAGYSCAMPLPTLFQDDAAFGDDHSFWLRALRKWSEPQGVPDPTFKWETVDDERTTGVDVRLSRGPEYLPFTALQLKRDRHGDENTVLETSRNVAHGLPGWIERDFPQLDYLVMSYSDTVLHTFHWPLLRRWWVNVGRGWYWYKQRETHVSRSPTGSWSGAYVLIPTAKLHEEVGGWITQLK